MTGELPHRPLRIVLGPMSEQWTGGLEYYRLLRAAFATLRAGERPMTGLMSWDAQADSGRVGDLADELVFVAPGSTGLTAGQRVGNRLARLGMPLRAISTAELALRRFGADVLFGTQVYRGVGRVPYLGWIPDFQYVHVPEAYGHQRVEQVHRAAEEIALAADRLLLSSEAVKADLVRLFPDAVVRARVVRFVCPVPADIYERDPAWVCDEYHLPSRYFYVPNQFWAHKNHRLVLDALRMEPAHSAGAVVVCTGNPHDDRNPTFFGELLTDIARAGLRERMIVLGFVPRAHVLPLMRQSIALLQPSRFEGWNTGIEEAKSLGKAVVASDLPVHREQDPPGGVYFDVNDAGDLSRVLAELWRSGQPGPDPELEAAARDAMSQRLVQFARRFLEVARETAMCRPGW